MARPRTAAATPPANPTVVVGLALFLAVVLVYFPTREYGFLGWDDPAHVTENPAVQAGLNADGLRLAFTSATAGSWQPLTVLSLQLDHGLFGNSPDRFHEVNLLLHAAATVALFLALHRLTGRLWASAWVAALFGLHPLHVESVAWVSERKDVLSGLFWMLTLAAYARYAMAPSWQRLAVVAAAMALGLMAKPMLVTLPCVLLLLDYWPLRRLAPDGASGRVDRPWRLVAEKLPLFALSGLVCLVTVVTQRQAHALRTVAERPWWLRLENAVVAYVAYLRQTVWPTGLAAFYPLPAHGWPAWQVAGAALLLLAVSALAWRERRRRPYLLVGWLWYVGTLVPVIGLVPVGDQARADRYTYLSLIGIFIAAAWGGSEWLAARGLPRPAIGVLGGLVVALCVPVTGVQLGYWQDDDRLWRHALAVTEQNDVAHNNLGVVLGERDDLAGAVQQFREAVAINPRNDDAQVNLARALMLQDKPKEAIERLRAALEVHPENEAARQMLAGLLAKR